jgi:peptidoglycan/LPS O-acetylase OafA/YrhL
LRLICALSVFLYHFGIGSPNDDAWQTFKIGDFEPSWTGNDFLQNWSLFGYLGVDVFFFLSGVVITRTIAGRKSTDFLLARFQRLFLPFLIVLIPTLFIYHFYSIKAPLLESSILDFAFSAQWKGLQPIIAATWTLVYEVNFYLIVFCFMIARELIQKVGYKFSETSLFVSWLILSSVSKTDQFPAPFDILNLGGFSILFIGGALSYLLITNPTSMNMIVRTWLITLIYTQMAIHIKGRMSAGDNALKVSIAITLLLLLSVVITGKTKNHQNNFNFLGELSFLTYTFYLLHQQVGLFFATLLTNQFGVSIGMTLFFIPFMLFILSFAIEKVSSKTWALASKGEFR